MVTLGRRPLRQVIVGACIILAIFFFARKRGAPTLHVLDPSLLDTTSLDDSGNVLLPQDVDAVCAAHGFQSFTPRNDTPRKVYDLFLFSTELDWLEIRLNTLAPYVDYFVIVESDRTFTGHPKPAVLRDNWDRFAPFHSKIIHRVIKDDLESSRTWDHEDYLRNALLRKTFFGLVRTAREAKHGDAIVVSDIDEIPKPATLLLLRACAFPERLTLRAHFYYYSFQWLHRGPQWAHPQATVYHGVDGTVEPKDLRNGEGGPEWFFLRPLQRWLSKAELWSAAWHCSSCFERVEQMQEKMGSFSHTGWNTEANRDAATIVERVRNGLDLFGREGEFYDKVEGNLDVPDFILADRERFRYLLDRDGEDAAFIDYSPPRPPQGAPALDEGSSSPLE